MKNKSTMDTRLRMIEELYDGDDHLDARIRVERPELQDELTSMQSVKSALDARPRRRPDVETVDAVLRAAADVSAGRPPAGRHPRARQDRKPRARRAVYLRSAGMATAVLTVLIAVSTVWQTDILDGLSPFTGDRMVTEETADHRAPAAADAARADDGARADAVDETPDDEQVSAGRDRADARRAQSERAASMGRYEITGPAILKGEEMAAARAAVADRKSASTNTAPGIVAMKPTIRHIDSGFAAEPYRNRGQNLLTGRRPSDILPVAMRPTARTAFVAERGNDGLAWDQAGDVMEMYHQIEMIEDGVSRGWEPPSIPLEMAPASLERRATGIQPAGERRIP